MKDRLDNLIMLRCFTLARRAGKHTKSNPQVGAVLVYKNKIIGEGYHKNLGGPHAEVNCLNNVNPEDRKYISKSTLYVSLEPCCHFGKTPPCTSLIIENRISEVVISTLDPSRKMNGEGVRILLDHGIKVRMGIKEEQGKLLIKPFKVQQKYQRPYIVLKIVKSKDNFIGRQGEQIWLTNPYSDQLTHKWRSEMDGILVGTNTVINDKPSLTTRNYPGENAAKLIIDRNHRIPLANPTLDNSNQLVYISRKFRQGIPTENQIIMDNENDLNSAMKECLTRGINRLLVEGGSTIQKSFYDQGLWDEARVISTPRVLHEGIKSIDVQGYLIDQVTLLDNDVKYISRQIS